MTTTLILFNPHVYKLLFIQVYDLKLAEGALFSPEFVHTDFQEKKNFLNTKPSSSQFYAIAIHVKDRTYTQYENLLFFLLKHITSKKLRKTTGVFGQKTQIRAVH